MSVNFLAHLLFFYVTNLAMSFLSCLCCVSSVSTITTRYNSNHTGQVVCTGFVLRHGKFSHFLFCLAIYCINLCTLLSNRVTCNPLQIVMLLHVNQTNVIRFLQKMFGYCVMEQVCDLSFPMIFHNLHLYANPLQSYTYQKKF